jgi:4-amino-4-deoxy-L-arabinose transferase-like glycosyltransferase/membrane-associated phospholipid phosphatase
VHWIQSIDLALFRFLNTTLSNPVFDQVMPFASGNRFFMPVLVITGLVLLWKGGRRARLCLLMAALIIPAGDGLITNTLKHAFARPRPFVTLENVRLYGVEKKSPPPEPMLTAAAPSGQPNHNSLPSAHAANWFAATMIVLVYYRRSWRFMLPLALTVAFSRIYNGVHYPGDVLVGAMLGAGYAAAGIWAINAFWIWAGRNWFPLWWEKLPSLVNPEARSQKSVVRMEKQTTDDHWLHLGYLLLAVSLLTNLAYLASGAVELTGDEAYQWVWSKHPALSYYSKPPMIAVLQYAGTHLWGDTEFGVRFFSPVISTVLGWLLLRFFARETSARMGCLVLLILQATPMLAAGSILMTIDPPSVLFWTAAMLAGWRAVQPDGKTSHWCWVGLWMGLGFLSKYTQLFQLLCWVVFFALWQPARAHLRRPGPYLALLLNLLGTLPVLIWNQQHDWITVTHVAERSGNGHAWQPTLRYLLDFLGAETGLLNPFFFLPTLWAAVAFWRRDRRNARMVFLFSMGAPLFLSYLLFSFRAPVLPNWIAPAVIPLFCLSVLYWDPFLQTSRTLQLLQTLGIILGITLVVLLHDPRLIGKIIDHPLPPKLDPLTRARGNAELARLTEAARQQLQTQTGQPAFIIGGHYGITGELSFYLPEARTNIVSQPLVYFLTSTKPLNQFYFWPGYHATRRGQNAIFVREIPLPPLTNGWTGQWLKGETNLNGNFTADFSAPPTLQQEFESVTDLGLRAAVVRGQTYRYLQLFECRQLK